MAMRLLTITVVLSTLIGAVAMAQTPPPAPAGAPNPNDQIELSQAAGDWTVRCFKVKSPAPCDMQQVTINKDNQQRVMSLSIAYLPSRDSYAFQIVVPTGVQLSKGVVLGTGPLAANPMKYSRCERDGCYVETLTDASTIAALAALGKATQVVVIAYGKTDDIKLPVSLTGFTEAVARLKDLAKDRATALPPLPATAQGAAPAAASVPAPAPAKAPAKAKGK